MAPRSRKAQHLKDTGSLNRHPERVRAPWFKDEGFFDAHDLVQVKYEMLRQVRIEGTEKSQAAALFGVSRPTFYQAEADFERAGLSGLIPKVRGPKGAHKLTAEVMRFIQERIAVADPPGARTVAQLIKAELGLTIHPRSIERALARKKKTVVDSAALPATAVEVYESLRAEVLRGQARPDGLGAIVYHGMLGGLARLIYPAMTSIHIPLPSSALPNMREDAAFVRLVANMVLQAQSEVQHAY